MPLLIANDNHNFFYYNKSDSDCNNDSNNFNNDNRNTSDDYNVMRMQTTHALMIKSKLLCFAHVRSCETS